MGSQQLIIRICRHILPDGRHCQGAAVRGRAWISPPPPSPPNLPPVYAAPITPMFPITYL
jgi:hypothetical protein